jgi:hypothetical protein
MPGNNFQDQSMCDIFSPSYNMLDLNLLRNQSNYAHKNIMILDC